MMYQLLNLRKVLVLFFMVFMIFENNSFSMSIGRDGGSVVENGIAWQPVKFVDDDSSGFKAQLPGENSSGISSPWYYVFSKFNDTNFEIHTHMKERYKGSKEELVRILKETSKSVTPLNNTKEIKNGYECLTLNEEGTPIKILRVYWTKDNRLYYAIAEGMDLSLASIFFDRIEFKLSKKK